MVKGISRQVIVVQSPDPKLFDQAIFILKDGQQGLSNAALLKEAKRLINLPERKKRLTIKELVWALVGALAASVVWLILLSLAKIIPL